MKAIKLRVDCRECTTQKSMFIIYSLDEHFCSEESRSGGRNLQQKKLGMMMKRVALCNFGTFSAEGQSRGSKQTRDNTWLRSLYWYRWLQSLGSVYFCMLNLWYYFRERLLRDWALTAHQCRLLTTVGLPVSGGWTTEVKRLWMAGKRGRVSLLEHSTTGRSKWNHRTSLTTSNNHADKRLQWISFDIIYASGVTRQLVWLIVLDSVYLAPRSV